MNSLFDQDQIVYSMDASSLIEAYHSYPFDIFPSLWDKLEELIKSDRNKAQILTPLLVDPDTGDSGGDPWVIALAQDLQNGVVVTQEKISRNKDKPKIPNICDDLGIECIDILGLMRKEKWIFDSIILERNQENAE